MKSSILLIFCFVLLCISQAAFGQNNGTSSNNDPNHPQPAWVDDVERNREMTNRRVGLDNRGMIIKNDNYPKSVPVYGGRAAEIKELLDAFYRTNAMIVVPNNYIEKYALLLKDKKFGIARIQPERNCYKNILVTVEELEKCSDVVPITGGGSFYSFRSKLNYQVEPALASFKVNGKTFKNRPKLDPRKVGVWWNLHFEDGKFKVTNDSVLGIIAQIGDVELENLSSNSKEIEFLNNFKFKKDVEEIKKQNENLANGISFNNLTYSNAAQANLNSTYVLRSIDYQDKQIIFFPQPMFPKPGNEADMTIAFKVIGQEDDGSLIILWRKLKAKQNLK